MKILLNRQFVSRCLTCLALAAYVGAGVASLKATPEAASLSPPPRPGATKPAGPSTPRTAVPVATPTPRAAAPQPSRVRTEVIPGLASRLRDPFRAPEEEVKHNAAALKPLPATRPPGSRGLLADQLRLQGIVREEVTHRMIAMVASQSNLSYFLREDDQLYDGVVSRITADALYIRRTGSGPRAGSGEVVLRLGPGAGGQ